MEYKYQARGTCAHEIIINTEEGVIKDVSFVGGCSGNLKGMSVMLRGMRVDEAVEKLEGIKCGFKSTSCPDQLAKALKKIECPERQKNFAIILADKNEYAPFEEWALQNGGAKKERYSRTGVSLTYNNAEITAIHSGVGKVNAACAAAHLISDLRPDFMLNTGLSGAVGETARGDIIAGKTYLECDFDITPTGRRLGEKPDQASIYKADETLLEAAMAIEGIKSAPLGTGDFFLINKEQGERYKDIFDIAAFDMESAAIASACHFAAVPFISIRKISDDADETAVEDYREMDKKQEGTLTEILLRIIRACS